MNIDAILKQIKDLDFSKYPYYETLELIRSLGRNAFLIFTLHPGKAMTRARPGNGFKQKSDLSYKPQQFNDTCQRASTPNKTMFYGTIIEEGESFEKSRIIASCECSSLLRGGIDKVGIEKITFGRWQIIKDINLVTILHKDIFSNPSNNPLLKELQKSHSEFIESKPDISEHIDKIARFFAEEFSKESIVNDYDYFISAIFSEFVVSELEYDGIMYPSVRTSGQLGFNVAIKPEIVDNNMRLDVVGESTLYKKGDKSINIIDKISCMNSWEYKESISSKDEQEILERLNVSSLEELNINT